MIYTPVEANATVAAFGRNNKGACAAFGSAAIFVVFFVVALNEVYIVAINTRFVLRLSMTGRPVGRTNGRTDDWSGKSD